MASGGFRRKLRWIDRNFGASHRKSGATAKAQAIDGEVIHPVTELIGRPEQAFGLIDGNDIRQALGLRRLDQTHIQPSLCKAREQHYTESFTEKRETTTMIVTVEIEIDRSRDSVWKAITDIDNCENMISSIIRANVLHKPSDGLVGLKWEETRKMFGKEAMETMWITDSVANEYYCTRAESHGSVYITRLSLRDSGSGTLLTMSFRGIAQTNLAKVLSFLMGPFVGGSIKKALVKDLEDIKAFVENN